MKVLTQKGVFRLLASLICLLGTLSLTATAQEVNKLYIADFNISGNSTTRVAVELENTPDLAALQFNVNLPAGWEIVNVERNADRLNVGQNMTYAPGKSLIMVTSGSKNPFIGTSGPLAWLDIKATEQDIEDGIDGKITLSNIIFSSYAGKRLPGETSTTTNVSVQAGSGVLSTSESEFVLNPTASHKVEVSLANDFDVRGLQMNIVVPEGFSILGNQVSITNRISNGSNVTLIPHNDGVTYGLVIADFNGKNIIPTGEGKIFEFTLVAPADFEADNVTVMFNKFEMANNKNKTIYGEGCDINIINGKVAHQSALDVVNGLQLKLDNALETIKNDCPLVADNYSGAELQASIDALKAAIEEAYENHTLTGNYENIIAPAEGISSDIDAYLANAIAAENGEVQRRADNKAAYEADLAEFAALQTLLDNVKKEIADNYATHRDEAAENAAQKAIDDMKAKAEEIYNSVAEEGIYIYNPDTAAVEAQINALLTDAQAKATEADRQAANKAAYEADLAQIAQLQSQLDAAKAEIADKYAAFADPAAEKAAQDAIDALTQAVNNAYEAVANEGTYSYTLDTTAVAAQIAALVTDAAARAKAEADRQAANKAAYEADLQKIAGLQTQLEAAKAEIADKYAAFADPAAEKAAQDAIDALTQAVNNAYEAVANEGTYSYTLDTTAVAAQIAALVTDAAARAKAEADRQAANKAAYEADLQKIAGLQTQLEAAKAEIAEKYAGFEDPAAEKAAQDAIDALTQAVNNAYEAVANSGLYDYKLDTTAVAAQIAALVTDAANRYAAEKDREGYNKAAYEDDLQKIADLQAQLDAAKAEIADKYADYASAEEEAAAQKAVNDLRAAVEAAYAAVANEGVYGYKINTAEAQALINALVPDAAARANEADRQAANKAAYEADLQKLAELQTQLDAAKDEIAEKYADFADPAAEKAAQDAIDALTQAVNNAYEAVANEGRYDYKLDTTALAAQIAALVTDAAARANEADRQAANKAAYEADLQKIADLQAQLDAAKAEVRENYNGFQDTSSEDYIQTQIDMLKLGATNAYNAVAAAGSYNYDMNTAGIEARIEELVPAAAEAYRKDVNTKAYDADLKLITKLENEFQSALMTVQALYPSYIDSEYVTNMRQQLDEAIAACDREYADVENEGFYESQVNYDSLSAAIKTMLEEIKTSGIDTILNDVDLTNAEIYTVDGQRHNAPVRGQMNIIRLADGSVIKVMVK